MKEKNKNEKIIITANYFENLFRFIKQYPDTEIISYKYLKSIEEIKDISNFKKIEITFDGFNYIAVLHGNIEAIGNSLQKGFKLGIEVDTNKSVIEKYNLFKI